MRAGELRETVTIQREVRTPDDRKGATVEWETVCTVAAAIDENWVRERLAMSGLQAEGGTTVRIRYRPDINATMRAVIASGPFAGVYNIRGALVINARGTARPEAIALACERGVAV